MRRLDSRFPSLWNKFLFYGFIIFMWGLSIEPFITGSVVKQQRVRPMLFYVLPPATILLLWFFSRFKQVTLDGSTLVIRGFQREARIPVSQIQQIYRRNGQMPYISIVFKSGTEFGRCVRIFTSCDGKAEKLLRAAMEGKEIGKVHLVSSQSAEKPGQHRKEILVSGWTTEDLSNILKDFAELNAGKLGKEFDYEVSLPGQGPMRIIFPHDIAPNEFSFLVNYLNYPKDYDLKTRSVSVLGHAALTAAFHLPNKNLIGKNAVFYVPANDQDYDLVYIRVDDETYVNSFAGFRWKKV
jgi:hypothetical protein